MADRVPPSVLACLRRAPELARLCSQNGWIDNDTLAAEVVERRPDGTLVVAVTFEEVVVEAAGCVGTRVPCYGRVHARLDASGRLRQATLVE